MGDSHPTEIPSRREVMHGKQIAPDYFGDWAEHGRSSNAAGETGRDETAHDDPPKEKDGR